MFLMVTYPSDVSDVLNPGRAPKSVAGRNNLQAIIHKDVDSFQDRLFRASIWASFYTQDRQVALSMFGSDTDYPSE